MALFGKKEPEKKKKELPGLAKGVLHKESLAPPSEVPISLPTVAPKNAIPEKLPEHLFHPEDKPSFFSEHNDSHFQSVPIKHDEDEAKKSFFSDLAKHISEEERLFEKEQRDALSNRNFVGEMKDYWASQKAAMNIFRQNKQLEAEVLERVDELKKLESDWEYLEDQMEKTRHELMEKEHQIEEESRKLKILMQRWALKRDAKIGQYFFLSNGDQCKNVAELVYSLRKISDTDFEKHVQFGRNDFASWIKDVFQDYELANELEMHKDKSRIIEILDKALN